MVDVSGRNGKGFKLSIGAILTAVAIFAGGELWLITEVHSITDQNKDSMMIMEGRVARLEEENKEGQIERNRLADMVDKTNVFLDQQRAATEELANSLAKVQQVLEDIRVKR